MCACVCVWIVVLACGSSLCSSQRSLVTFLMCSLLLFGCRYLQWRVAMGYHETATLHFMVGGHTKNVCDSHFGVLKAALDRVGAITPYDLIKAIETTKSNKVVHASDVKWLDFKALTEKYFELKQGKVVPDFSKRHVFTANHSNYGQVTVENLTGDPQETFNTYKAATTTAKLRTESIEWLENLTGMNTLPNAPIEPLRYERIMKEVVNYYWRHPDDARRIAYFANGTEPYTENHEDLPTVHLQDIIAEIEGAVSARKRKATATTTKDKRAKLADSNNSTPDKTTTQILQDLTNKVQQTRKQPTCKICQQPRKGHPKRGCNTVAAALPTYPIAAEPDIARASEEPIPQVPVPSPVLAADSIRQGAKGNDSHQGDSITDNDIGKDYQDNSIANDDEDAGDDSFEFALDYDMPDEDFDLDHEEDLDADAGTDTPGPAFDYADEDDNHEQHCVEEGEGEDCDEQEEEGDDGFNIAEDETGDEDYWEFLRFRCDDDDDDGNYDNCVDA